jgi:hypothetical protein
LIDHRRFARLGFSLSNNLRITPKETDNRRAPRRPCELSAWIRLDGSFATQQCQILDRSQTGIRLLVTDASTIRSRFVLLWSRNGTGRRASIKWRRSNQIGAEFLTADDLRPIYLARRIADNVARLRQLQLR